MLASAVGRIRQILTPRHHAVSSEATRSAERHRRAFLTSITGIAARIVGMSASLITIPLTLHYLGTERFGLWMTISAVIALASFADFGIGLGVVNTIASASGKDDHDTIRRAISSAFTVLTLIAGTLVTAFFVSYRFISWGHIFRVTSAQAGAEAGPAMIAFVLCFALNIPLDIVQRVQLGLQEGFRTNLWQLCSNAFSVAGVVLAVHLRLGVPGIVLAFAGAPVVGAGLNALYFFGFKRRDLFPRWGHICPEIITSIIRLGGMFFLIQIVITLSFSTDNLIVARALGAASVGAYAIPQRMFSLISVVIFTMVTPLWPAYGEAATRGDIPWIKRILSRTLLAVFIGATIVAAAILLLAHRILLIWVGPAIHPAFMLLLGLAIWEVVRSCTGTLQMFLNGAGFMRFQTITHCIFGVLCVTAKYWCAKHYGIQGVPWAGVVTYTLVILLPAIWFTPGLLRGLAAGSISPLANLQPEMDSGQTLS